MNGLKFVRLQHDNTSVLSFIILPLSLWRSFYANRFFVKKTINSTMLETFILLEFQIISDSKRPIGSNSLDCCIRVKKTSIGIHIKVSRDNIMALYYSLLNVFIKCKFGIWGWTREMESMYFISSTAILFSICYSLYLFIFFFFLLSQGRWNKRASWCS